MNDKSNTMLGVIKDGDVEKPANDPLVTIRAAFPRDLETLLQYAEVFFKDAPEIKDLNRDPEKMLVFLFNMMIRQDGFLLVSEVDGVLAGALIAVLDSPWYTSDIIAVEQAFFILPEYRGAELARSMLLCYIEWAAKMQAVRVRIGSSTGTDMDKIEGLYESAGFKKVGLNFSRGG